MNRPEEVLHRAIMAYLAVRLPPGWLFWHTPNGGGRSKAEAGILKAMGVLPGVPDIFILGPGSTLIAIEVKAPPKRLRNGKLSTAKAVLSDAQKALFPKLAGLGVPVIIARSIDDVQRGLDGLIRSEARRAAINAAVEAKMNLGPRT